MSNEEIGSKVHLNGAQYSPDCDNHGNRPGEAMIKLYHTDTVIYTASEVAEILGVSAVQVSRLCAKYDAPRLGKFFLINEELLEDLKNRNTSTGRPRKGL